MATASEVMGQLAALAGENEAAVGSNNTAVNKFFGAVGQAYCGYSLLYAFTRAGSSLLNGSGAWNVGSLARFCEGKGWRVSAPKAGDIFVMRAGGYENGHTGFVYEVLGTGYFITLEGNYGSVKATAEEAKNGTGKSFEGIGYRKAPINGDYKFYRPPYIGSQASQSEKVGAAVTVSVNTLQSGSTGAQVKTVQRILAAGGFKGADGKTLQADGEFGPNTVCAVKSAQEKLDLAADGVVGQNTWEILLKKLA